MSPPLDAWPLWCCWCDCPLRVGIGPAPLTVCNDCFEILDRLDALMGRMRRRGTGAAS